ncbi:hypothetical protein V426_1915 [Acinetobacter baumannii UH9907]|uniref:Uncharacterized protein n=2 Tax=Acinetobacter baumannii TaxID=470 RepID=A0A009HKX1_ACIB9|nr:hypothetical protein AYP_003964 [Acinetobacter baumannii]ETR49410.1 hypothetical protein V426_1915 [Acinetobacter baumannii UH9907]EXA93406.1 hypothetical protein J507_3942 [Acinetobacter sp. 1295259]EXB03685.1 hypothetical protein J512_3854 [Acinetobacter baumannii 1295743]EXB50331.1 hypothetical protein J540_2079 [Acinetobacter baumannii 1440422]EXD85184.1 hypothetical protein J462_3491 [Acinetobacter baumannii 972082]EXE03372.1 hypothetical protein J553_1748 [Acinetobacter baumannii 129
MVIYTNLDFVTFSSLGGAMKEKFKNSNLKGMNSKKPELDRAVRIKTD